MLIRLSAGPQIASGARKALFPTTIFGDALQNSMVAQTGSYVEPGPCEFVTPDNVFRSLNVETCGLFPLGAANDQKRRRATRA